MADPKINWELGPKAQWRDITGGQPTKFSIFHSNDQKTLTIEPPIGENYKPLTIQSDGTVDAGKFTGDGSDLKVGAGLSVKDALAQKAALNGADSQDFQTKNLTVSGSLNFGSRRGLMINTWNGKIGIGIQDSTQYFRTSKNFAWYKGGSHNDGELNAGGGKVQMVIKDGNVGIGTSDPKAKIEISAPKEGVALNIGRKAGQASIKGLGDWLILDAPKDGGLGLNYWEKGNVFIAKGGGNVGIGPKANLRLDVDGWIGSSSSSQSTGGWRLGRWPGYKSGNQWVYLSQADSTKYKNLAVGDLYVKGTITYQGHNFVFASGIFKNAYNVEATSDRRLKKNLIQITTPLEKVRRLRGIAYQWNNEALQYFTKDIETTISAGPEASAKDNQKLWQAERDKRYKELAKTNVGVVAQDVEAVLPEAVTTDEAGYKAVKYEQLIALLIEAVKEQHEHLRKCYAKITNLEKFDRSVLENVAKA